MRENQKAAQTLCADVVLSRLSDTQLSASVQTVMNTYLEGAVNVVCSGNAMERLFAETDSPTDETLVSAGVALVVAYLEGCVRLHAASMEGV